MKIVATRKIDELGRIMLTKELRETMNWKTGDSLNLTCTKEGVLLSSPEQACILCGGSNDLLTLNEKPICRQCIQVIQHL